MVIRRLSAIDQQIDQSRLVRVSNHIYACIVIFLSILTLFLQSTAVAADTVAARHKSGLLHGFLVLRNLDGNPIADGDLTQVAQGDRITIRLLFHFRDGSIHEETTIYSQSAALKLLSDRLIQKGPAFKRPMETSLDASTGVITVRYAEEDGKQKTIAEKIVIPPDAANGLIPTILENFSASGSPSKVSMVVATPKPRIVKLAISPEGLDSFSVGVITYKATKYVVKVEIGGAAGAIAPLLGKTPPDIHFWVTAGNAPVFVKSEGALYEGGPVWRIEMAAPIWSTERSQNSPAK